MELDQWLIEFANLFREHTGLDPERHLDLNAVGWDRIQVRGGRFWADMHRTCCPPVHTWRQICFLQHFYFCDSCECPAGAWLCSHCNTSYRIVASRLHDLFKCVPSE